METPEINNTEGGEYVGGFFFPHGAIALDPKTRDFTKVPAAKPTSVEECIRLHESSILQAKLLIDQKPDLIVLSTPHGLKLRDTFLFFGNSRASGSAEWDGEWSEFKAEAVVDTNATDVLVNDLQNKQHSVEVIGFGVQTKSTLQLCWGEVIPLWFINKVATENNFTMPPVVIIGQRQIGTDQPLQVRLQALIKFGRDLISSVTTNSHFNGKRIAVVVSGDLAHTHSKCKTAPYPYHPSCTSFDAYILEWARTSISLDTLEISKQILIEKAGNLISTALTCGFTGLVMLQGLMEEILKTKRVKEFKASVLEYSAPTYYGMMVNSFIPQSRTDRD